jgi:hypothetical protein
MEILEESEVRRESHQRVLEVQRLISILPSYRKDASLHKHKKPQYSYLPTQQKDLNAPPDREHQAPVAGLGRDGGG